jgi:hypothetical protein
MKNLLIALLLIISVSLFSQNILYSESADGSTVFATGVSKQTTSKHGIKATKCVAFNGTQSVRFELRDTDAMNNSGTRAEVSFPAATNVNRWYAFAIQFPCMDFEYDTDDEVLTQWHQGGGATPALVIRTKKDSIYLRVMGKIWLNLGRIEKDVWRSYVFHVVHSSTATGLVQIWRDGQVILNRQGQNMYPVGSTYKMPNWKLGIYKSGWNDSETTMTNRRVVLYDAIKMGNENATFEDMVPKR